MFPLMVTDGVIGAAYLESDGYVDPTQLCYALANLARHAGVAIRTHTRVLGIDTTARDCAGGCPGYGPTRAISSARWSSTPVACSPPRSPAWSTCEYPSYRCRISIS